MRHTFKLMAVAALAAVVGVQTVRAAEDDSKHHATGPDAVVAKRQIIMDGIGGDMGVLVCVAKGECALKDEVVKHNAESLAFMAMLSKDAFENMAAGAMMKTTAAAAIWEKWSDFEGGLKALAQQAKKVEAAVGTPAFGAEVGEMGKVCKDCHDNFRTQ